MHSILCFLNVFGSFALSNQLFNSPFCAAYSWALPAQVDPVLTVIASKSLDQALMEVLEEEELKEMKEHRDAFNQERNVKMAELQRLFEKDQRFEQERERRIQQAEDRVGGVQEALRKREAALAAKDFVTDLQDNVLMKLAGAGYFYDPVLKQVQGTFLPWLVKRVGEGLQAATASRLQVDNIMLHAVKSNSDEISSNVRAIKHKVVASVTKTRTDQENWEKRQKELEDEKLADEQAVLEKKAAEEVARQEKAEAAEGGEGDEGDAAADAGDGGGGGDEDEGDEGDENKAAEPVKTYTQAPLPPETHDSLEFGILAMAHQRAFNEEARRLQGAFGAQEDNPNRVSYHDTFAFFLPLPIPPVFSPTPLTLCLHWPLNFTKYYCSHRNQICFHTTKYSSIRLRWPRSLS